MNQKIRYQNTVPLKDTTKNQEIASIKNRN